MRFGAGAAIAISLLVVGSPDANPVKPACRVETRFTDASRGNAGCLLVAKDRLLLVRHRVGGKLGFPGGHAEGPESAQCTAHRETWEETGLDVEVGPLVRTFDNGFRLYVCRANLLSPSAIQVPPQGLAEVTQVEWRTGAELVEADWRFPQYFGEVKALLAEKAR